jgi:cytochrome c oxidase subunit 3
MTLFVSSEVMFFGGLFASYFLLRGTTTPWPPDGTVETTLVLPLVLTACLLGSSATVHAGAGAAHAGRRRDAARWLGITIGLGAAFLAGQAYEYSQLAAEGAAASADVFSTLFFTITGFHGLHVAIGLVMLVTVLLRLDRYGGRGPVEAAACYWHFVDAVWVVVFLTMYVLR